MAAYSNMPDGMEPGLENNAYYDPPNLTWPFACYIVTVEVDPDTGVWDVLHIVAVDDCGVRINPMIVEGQIMGGLTEAYAMANMQFITFDAEGNCVGSNYMDYLLPTAWETPGFELHEVVTPCPHHPIGAKGVGECAAVGGPGGVRQRGDGRAQRHRGPQHRHAAAARPGLGGASPPARRVRRARRCETDDVKDRTPWTSGGTAGPCWSRPASWPARARRSRWPRWSGGRDRRRARQGRGRSSRRRRAPRLDRRRLRRAGRHPRGAPGHRRGDAAAAAARHPGAVRRRGTRRHDRRAHLLPERRGAGGLHRAGAAGAAPGRRRATRRWPRRWPSWPRPRLAGGADRRPGLHARFLARRGGGNSMVVVATQGHGDEEAVEQAVAAQPRLPRPGGVAPPRRSGARLPGRARACRRTSSTGSACPPASTWVATSHQEIAVGDPGRAGPAAGLRGAEPGARVRRPRPRPAGDADRHRRRAGRGGRPGLRDDRDGGPACPPGASTRVPTYYFCCAGCRREFEKDPGGLRERRGTMLIKSEFEVAAPVEKVWRFFDDIPTGGSVPAGRRAHRRPRRQQVQGPGRGPDGPGQAEVRRHRRHHRARTTPPSGSSCRPAALKKGGKGQAEMTVTATLTGSGGGTKVVVDQDLQLSGAAAQYGRGMISDVTSVLMQRVLGQPAEPDRRRRARRVRRAARPTSASRPDHRPAGRCLALKRVFRRFFVPLSARDARRAHMMLWWIGNAVLLLVVFPVVVISAQLCAHRYRADRGGHRRDPAPAGSR